MSFAQVPSPDPFAPIGSGAGVSTPGELPINGAPQDLPVVSEAQLTLEDEQLATQVWREYLWARGQREAIYDWRWEECYRQYRNGHPDERISGEWRSKVKAPIAFTKVEQAVPHILNAIFSDPDYLRVKKPPFSAGGEQLAALHERLVKAQLSGDMEIEETIEEGTRQKLIYGTTAYYVGFEIRTSEVMQYSMQQQSALPGDMALVEEAREGFDYIGNYCEVVDITRLYPHPYSTRKFIPKLWWLQYKTMEQLEQSNRFKNLDLVKKYCAGRYLQGIPTGYISDRMWEFGLVNNVNLPGGSDKLYEVVTMYNEQMKRVVTVVEGKVPIEDSPYPFRHARLPIVFDRHFKQTNEFYGIGLIEPIQQLISEQNTIRNQRRDNVHLILNTMFEVPDGAVEDEQEELVSRPGQVIHSRTGNDVKVIAPTMVTTDSQTELNRNDAEIDAAIGGSSVLSGDPVGSSGVDNNMMAKASLYRLERSARNTAKALKNIVEMMISNNSQFYPLDEVREAFCAQSAGLWEGYPPEDITYMANVEVQVQSLNRDPNVERQQLSNFINILGANPMFAQRVDWDYQLAQVARAFGQDPIKAVKQENPIPEWHLLVAYQEDQLFLAGQYVPMAAPDEDHKVHLSLHKQLLLQHPDLIQAMAPHLQSHISLQQQADMMAAMGGPAGPGVGPGMGPQLLLGAGENGPGSKPAGGRGGTSNGLNPNRQPNPSSSLGITRGQANLKGNR